MEIIGGYRIIRKLGSGERSDVYLGHAAAAPGSSPALGAIKVFRTGVSDASISAEISALSRLQHAHVVGLLDLATGPRDRPCLVLQRLGSGGLPSLLSGRASLQAGEAVTVLAPVVAAVAAMHRVGVSHGAIGARAIHFDDAGAPVIAGFGTATCFAASDTDLSEAALDAEPLVHADRSALVSLVQSVVDRTADVHETAGQFIHWLASRSGDEIDLAELEQRIFEFGEPLVVQFNDPLQPAVENAQPVPGRLVVTGVPADPQPWVDPAASGASAAPARGRAADLLSVLPPELAEWISATLSVVPSWLGSRVTRLRHHLQSVRKGVWVVAGVGLVAVATAGAISGLPIQGEAAETSPKQEARPPMIPEALSGDDPLAAVNELLRLRAQCLSDRSILCLDTVHAADSAAWQSDAKRIRSVQDGAELSRDPFMPGTTATLVDRLGQTALVELASAHTTASALMIRTEAGWRFRSLVADSAPVDGAVP